MSGVRSHQDRTTSKPPAAGSAAKSSSGTMPSRYVKNTPPSPTISSGSSATLQPDVKLRRTDSKASKSGDTNRRSFLGWFRHKAEPTTSSEAAAAKTPSSSKWKKKDGLSSLSRSSHLSDSLPSLVVPTVVHPAIIKHRQRDVDDAAPAAAAAVPASTVEAAVPAGDRLRSRFGSVGSKTDLKPSSRNRWSSYDIVGGYNSSSSTCSLSVPEEEVTIVVSTSTSSVDQIAVGRRSDGNGDAALPPPSPNRRSLLQVNSLPVVRTRSAELLTPSQADVVDGKSASATSLTTQDNAVVSSPGRDADHAVASPPLHTSTPAGHNDSKRDLIGRLRQTETTIETSVRLRKRLWATLLHIPDTDFDSVGELARQSSHGDGDPRELLLTSLIDADRVTSHLNVLLRSPRPYTPRNDDVTETVSHPQVPSSTAATPTPLDDVISPQLVDLGTHLHQQLKLLMDALAARDKEKAQLADRLADTRQQLDERRRQHEVKVDADRADRPDLTDSQSSTESSSNQEAPPGESEQINNATSTVDETAEVSVKAEEVVESAPPGADGESTAASSPDDSADNDSTNSIIANAADIHAEQNGSDAVRPAAVETDENPLPPASVTTDSPADGATADDPAAAAATDAPSDINLPSSPDGTVSVDAESKDSTAICRNTSDETVNGSESTRPETEGDENIAAGESTKTVLETIDEHVVFVANCGDE